jgi:hypothetical protein
MTSQNVTLSHTDWLDIEKMKPLLLDNKSQVEISVALGKRRETVNRKLSRWMRTQDFEDWLKQAWLDKYRKVDDVEAFRALTKIYCKLIGMRVESLEEVYEETRIVWEDNGFNKNSDDKVQSP